MIRTITAAAFLALLCAWVAPARAQGSYKLVDLGTGEATSVNRYGTVVGFQWNYSNSQFAGFIWDSVKGMRSLGTLPGYGSTPLSMNSSNMAVGYIQPYSGTNGTLHAACFTETEGTEDMNALLSPADQAVWDLEVANSINDEGIVVGYGLKNGVQLGWMMDLSTVPATITDIARPGYSIDSATSINSSCLIVGDNGNPVGTFALPMGGTYSSLGLRNAAIVNDNGDVAGRIVVTNVGTVAALRSASGVITTIGTLGGYSSTSCGLNVPSNGYPMTVAGYSAMKSGDQHGFRWQIGGKVLDLTSLVSNLPNRKWYVRSGQSVNGSGWIAGQASDGTYNHAIVLIP